MGKAMTPASNKYEEWLKNVGRKKKIQSPEELYKFFCDYREHEKNDPHKRQDFIRGGEAAGTKVDFDVVFPLTWDGFEAYLAELGIITNLDKYKMNFQGSYDEFVDIIRVIDKIMFKHNFNFAAIGAVKENIIARKLGIHDKQVLEITKEQPLFGDDPEN